MTPSKQQREALDFYWKDEHLLLKARAGCGKTQINEWGCRSNPSAKIVNLSFNASVKDEAKKRMPTNVSCKTFHGLAWPTHGFKYKHRLKWRFQAKRYAEMFRVDPMIVHAARATIGRFNSSDDMIIDRWHVPKEMWSAKPRSDQDGFRDEVVIAARKLWMMKRSLRDREMPVDFNDIRTMFRLDGCPGIGRYDKVVVDESQDITPCDAAMIARIGAPVVYTGDDCQQLYSWLGSIQNLDEMASVHKYLTESWRFGPAVADAANKVLALLKLNAPPLVGLGGPSKLSLDPPSGKHTVLCRTNAGLMAEALDAVRKCRSIHVVGNLMESVSLLESGYHLSIGDRDKVRHPSLLAIADWNEVEQLKDHDPDLSVLWSQVEKYGSQIPHFCEELREAGEMPAHKADVIISTVHKCVHPDTFVETPDGLLRIRDIPNHGVIATPNGIAEYQDKFTREECETFVISTRKNYQIEVTGDHGMMVWRNGEDVRVNADQIEVGDLLRVKLGCTIDPLEYPDIPVITKKMDVRTKIFATPLKMSESLGEFLGLMVADGTVFNRGFRLVKRHVDVVDRFGDLIFELFGVKPKPCDHEDTGGYEVCSVYLSEWLKSFGGLNPNDKSIPDIILRSPMSVQSSFLKGLFEDGTVNMKNGGFDHIHFETKHEEMARTVQLMLLRFGIISTVKTRKSKGFPITTVYIYGENVLEFSKRIGFVSQWKNDRLFANPGRAMKASNDYVPITTDELNSIRNCFVGMEYWNAKRAGRISRNKAMAVIDRAKDNGSIDAIMFLIDRMRWHYDPVASIKKSRSETMCVTVPFTWRFLQNGFDGFNSKGAQWSDVKLSGIDFPKLVSYSEKDRRHKVKRFEVYIYYVAVTRAIHTLYPNETYFQLDDWLELLS